VGSSTTLRVTLDAVGSCATHVGGAGFDNADFSLSTAPGFEPPFTLNAATSVEWDIVYHPAEVGSDIGTLEIASDDAAEPSIEVELHGDGS